MRRTRTTMPCWCRSTTTMRWGPRRSTAPALFASRRRFAVLLGRGPTWSGFREPDGELARCVAGELAVPSAGRRVFLDMGITMDDVALGSDSATTGRSSASVGRSIAFAISPGMVGGATGVSSRCPQGMPPARTRTVLVHEEGTRMIAIVGLLAQAGDKGADLDVASILGLHRRRRHRGCARAGSWCRATTPWASSARSCSVSSVR